MDPDQLASEKPADLDLHFFQNRKYPGLAEKWSRGKSPIFDSGYA